MWSRVHVYVCMKVMKPKKITYPKNMYIDLQIFLKIFHCDLSCMSTYFLIFHDQYCFNLCNLQDSSQTWKGGHYIKDAEVSKGTVNRLKFLLYTFKNSYIPNVNICTGPLFDTL